MLNQQKMVGESRVIFNSFRYRHSSSEVRSQFLEFFQGNGHKHIASSPVLPENDPSLLFVNAGMVQFKPVLQNLEDPPAPKVVNSQRCIRVGGKHNDLSQVGHDGSHLTMFEMLGSWSFNDYWKEEACTMAWNLLTQHYRLDPNRLYVTYFGGCQKSGLPPDFEVREVWLKLGVHPSHILPFGMKDNFWEMGTSGPCGPCTEIHYDYTNRGPDLVNAGTSENIEIWNLVFVQYNRLVSGQLQPLTGRHIDTGMGLERLVAVLNNSNSSFDSDLFQPIFEAISKQCNKPTYSGKFDESSELDTAYRILADHIRMITVCLADQVFPDQNHKLKFVLRKVFSIANTNFNAPPGLIKELSNYVIDSLGPTFPVIQSRENIIKLILEFEEDSYNKFMDKSEKSYHLLKSEYPAESETIDLNEATQFLESLRFLDKQQPCGSLDSALAYNLYESHGMQEQDIEKLSNIRNIQFDLDEFNKYFDQKKELSKLSSAQAQGLRLVLDKSVVKLTGTDDSSKYTYTRIGPDEYQFPNVEGNILQIVSGPNLVDSLKEGDEGIIFLDRTCFYSEAGGQIGDTGVIRTENGVFEVTNTQVLSGNLVAHMGHLISGSLTKDDTVTASIDSVKRLQAMRNHTATHVLNAVLHSLLPLTAQKSSLVKPEYLRFDFSCYNADTNLEFLRQLEDGVMEYISQGKQIHRTITDNSALASVDNIVTLPGEVYPDQVSLIDIDGVQVEPCCGTHLLNTQDIENFVIVGFKSASRGVKSVRCLTGESAILARENGVLVCEDILSYQEKLAGDCDKLDKSVLTYVENQISTWKKAISEPNFPAILNLELSTVLEAYRQRIIISTRATNKEDAKLQLEVALEEQKESPFLVTIIQTKKGKSNLSNFSKSAKKPSLIICIEGNTIKGKALVPGSVVSDDFNAKLWIEPVAACVSGSCQPPKGHDSAKNCNLASMKFKDLDMDQLKAALDKASEMAFKYIS